MYVTIAPSFRHHLIFSEGRCLRDGVWTVVTSRMALSICHPKYEYSVLTYLLCWLYSCSSCPVLLVLNGR
ncbi:hypothetical protein BJY52DRAFT_1178981 [Lactarius psammicola]|nr:hypothetical protein BJY52DRAFT_1178981 [Lactarius psammicola]